MGDMEIVNVAMAIDEADMEIVNVAMAIEEADMEIVNVEAFTEIVVEETPIGTVVAVDGAVKFKMNLVQKSCQVHTNINDKTPPKSLTSGWHQDWCNNQNIMIQHLKK